ncbi:MAG: M48 family metallopeptidase [Candidatus Omnitrophica bacterium]|nr:M48 family metallopeptidase [Candidatus Omnitrophota bacterium]
MVCKKIFHFIIFYILIFGNFGCVTLYNPATEKNEIIFIDTATEKSIGEAAAKDIPKRYKILHDYQLESRINNIGKRIGRVSDRQDIEYKFIILDSEELNAFTLPGGFIYINKGLIAALNEDEIAYVLAHEVGHLCARHIVKKLQANMAYQLILAISLSALNRSKIEPTTIKEGIDAIYNLVELKYSRSDEYEADRLAAKYTYKAGYNPYASISCLKKLQKSQKNNLKLLRYFRTHPYVDERIEVLMKFIPKIVENK